MDEAETCRRFVTALTLGVGFSARPRTGGPGQNRTVVVDRFAASNRAYSE